VELFEQIRREYEHGGGTIRGIAKKLGIRRRLPVLVGLGMSGVFDYAGPNRDSCYRRYSCCLPRICKTSGSGLYVLQGT
jgi:hypothetical protein